MGRFSLKQLVIFGLIAIVGIGIFLRTYHFSPWLHFELDQARDARVIDVALEGDPADLPLLGPKAGGTFLRLAPGYYYLQYLSALVFGGSPAGMAGFVAVFSILSIPLFYFLLRRYFSYPLSLGLTFLFSTSAYFVMYGRFAWNPNILPFFTMLGLYALLRSVDESEHQKERWFLAAVFSLILATHAHFLAFLAIPAIVIVFFLVKRPRFSLYSWLLAFSLVMVLYLPLALNEIETGGMNTQEFFGAITEKSTKEDHILPDKFFRNIAEHALGALLITTGFEGGTFPYFTWNESGRIWWTCNEKCDQGKWYGVATALVFGMSLLFLVFFWWKEREQKKKDFLLLSGIWFSVAFILFLPLSYGFAPRFFLLSGPLFIIFLGLFLLGVKQILGNGRVGTFVVGGSLAILVCSNLFFLFERFDELSRAGTEMIKNNPDRILKERVRVTMEQQTAIVDFLEKRQRETGYPVYMWSEPQHRRALKYLLEKRGVENAVLGFDGIYREGVYYLILRAQSDLEDALKKYREHYTIGETTPFGTLVAIELVPDPVAILAQRQDFSKPNPSDSTAPPRYTWREFFKRNAPITAPEEDTSLDQMEDKDASQDN